MSKKNKLSRQKEAHERLVRRESALKAQQAKRLAAKQANPVTKRRVPKNLVRGASKEPGKYEAALELVRERERKAAKKKTRRVAPKAAAAHDVGGPAATRRRVDAHVARNRQARGAIVARRRNMEEDKATSTTKSDDAPAPSSSSSKGAPKTQE